MISKLRHEVSKESNGVEISGKCSCFVKRKIDVDRDSYNDFYFVKKAACWTGAGDMLMRVSTDLTFAKFKR